MLRQEITNLIKKTLKEASLGDLEFSLKRPEEKNRGDYATNLTLKLVRALKMPPIKIAENLKPRILRLGVGLFEKVEIAEPGFINFFISKEYLQKQVLEILEAKENFGQLQLDAKQKINVEFISANPTGPLHVGNARGGFCGDVLANVLQKAGHKPFREYYVNDRGRQIKFLQDTLEGNVVYKNEYTDELIKRGEKNVGKAVDFIVGKIIKTTERMGIKFDKWFFESDLYPKEAKPALDFLVKKGLTFQGDGAIWFKSTQFGDDKDRVLVRSQEKTTYEEETYFLSDIAYLANKFKRGFDRLIIFLGAEHYGYVPRLSAAVQALGHDKEKITPIIYQLVRLIDAGQEVKMSKRTGVFVTIDELLNEVPLDAARFFFLMRGYGSHLNFDLELAREQSEKNPVYYVQYAYARICSIFTKTNLLNNPAMAGLLRSDSEFNLIKQLIRLPEVIEDTANDYQIQRLPQYATDLATAFHQFYRDCRVISEDKNLTQARLALVSAVKIVLKNTLSLMGISAPEKM